jgi:hypothetical protein
MSIFVHCAFLDMMVAATVVEAAYLPWAAVIVS